MEVAGVLPPSEETHWWHLAGVADSSLATPWRWEGFRTLERLHSGHMILLCRLWAHVPQVLMKLCLPVFNAEPWRSIFFFFTNTEQTGNKNHSVCPLVVPPPFFLELKSMSFGSLCIIGRVSMVPQDTVVENIWNFLTLQEKGLGTVGGFGVVFFSFLWMSGSMQTQYPGMGARRWHPPSAS